LLLCLGIDNPQEDHVTETRAVLDQLRDGALFSTGVEGDGQWRSRYLVQVTGAAEVQAEAAHVSENPFQAALTSGIRLAFSPPGIARPHLQCALLGTYPFLIKQSEPHCVKLLSVRSGNI
jgi:hypothetical protein